MSTGQPESKLYRHFTRIAEYDARTLVPRPALAERWEENNDSSEFVFHLRKNARWSNGDPIDAHDFIYSIRRGLTPKTARARPATPTTSSTHKRSTRVRFLLMTKGPISICWSAILQLAARLRP